MENEGETVVGTSEDKKRRPVYLRGINNLMYLGWSEGFHDAGVTVIDNNGDIVFASHSERFSGNKNDKYIGKYLSGFVDANWGNNIVHKAFFEKPLLKKTRQLYAGQLETFISPRPLAWKPDSTQYHHKSHAAAAFQTSDFTESATVVIDSIGEWDCTTIWKTGYKDSKATYKKVYSEKYPNSIGLWYSALTKYVGLRPLADEYIFMGMAAFGHLDKTCVKKLKALLELTNNHRGIPAGYLDYPNEVIAASAQHVLEEKLFKIFELARTYSDNICYGGGVALNCVANTKLQLLHNNLWIMPNPGDAGGSLGAAALAYGGKINWKTPFLGRDIDASSTPEHIAQEVVEELLKNGVVGIAHGRSEFGPRALGNRSLLADPRGKDAKDRINTIKKRQKFRPFAPVIREENAHEYFEIHSKDGSSPYMSFVYDGLKKDCPAILHKDNTARVQTVPWNSPSIIRTILDLWYEETGCPLLLNTSLNIRGKPMVDTCNDAHAFEMQYGVKVVY
jgi:carbamoyltransferase